MTDREENPDDERERPAIVVHIEMAIVAVALIMLLWKLIAAR